MGEGGCVRKSLKANPIEPPAPWSQTKNHTRLDHPPMLNKGNFISQ